MSQQDRFHLNRGGIINVCGTTGRRSTSPGAGCSCGANGAGKSKTMEMLLPFVVDGDKVASRRPASNLLWLMLDGHDGSGTGYVWVEFTGSRTVAPRRSPAGSVCRPRSPRERRPRGSSPHPTVWARVLSWRTSPDRSLHQRLKAEVEADGVGRVFDSAKRYREHVAGCSSASPSTSTTAPRSCSTGCASRRSEDIDPRLAEQLVNALPQVDDSAIRKAGDTFDELEAFGEQLEGRCRASAAISTFVETPCRLRTMRGGGARADQVIDADRHLRTCRRALRHAERELEEAAVALETTDIERATQQQLEEQARSRILALEAGRKRAPSKAGRHGESRRRPRRPHGDGGAPQKTPRGAAAAAERAVADERRLTTASTDLHAAAHSTGRALSDHGVSVRLAGLTAASALGTTEAETQPQRMRRGWRTCARNGCLDGVVVRLWSRRRGSGGQRCRSSGPRWRPPPPLASAPTALRSGERSGDCHTDRGCCGRRRCRGEPAPRTRAALRAVELAHERRPSRSSCPNSPLRACCCWRRSY